MAVSLLQLIFSIGDLFSIGKGGGNRNERRGHKRGYDTGVDAAPQFVAQLADRRDNFVTLDVWLDQKILADHPTTLEITASHGQHLGIATLGPKPARNGLLHYKIRDLELPPRSSHLFVIAIAGDMKLTQIVTVLHGLDVEETFAATRTLHVE